jgi:copper resistance protein B
MKGIAFAALAVGTALAFAGAASAQSMQGMDMKGMAMPMPAPKKKPAAKPTAKPQARPVAPTRMPTTMHPRSTAESPTPMPPQNMQGMAMPAAKPESSPAAGASAMPGMSMPGMDMTGGGADHGMAMPDAAQSGTALPAGDAPAPAPPSDHYADRQFPGEAMHRSRMAMMKEEGGRPISQIMFNLAEVQIRDGKDGYRWDGEGWFGGDINRLTIKTEGSGAFREGVESAEVQALYSRAVGPYFNLQAGVRHDFQPTPNRTYATIGFEGLAPYMFEVEGAVFLSNKGDLLGRLEGYYDQRITQRLILQPRIELNLSAQDVPENRLGAGLTDAELGLRLRYEIAREFAPYIGVSYEAKTGRTADFARADGKDATSTSFVAGVRFWF